MEGFFAHRALKISLSAPFFKWTVGLKWLFTHKKSFFSFWDLWSQVIRKVKRKSKFRPMTLIFWWKIANSILRKARKKQMSPMIFMLTAILAEAYCFYHVLKNLEGFEKIFSMLFMLTILHRTQIHQPQKFCLSLSLYIYISVIGLT